MFRMWMKWTAFCNAHARSAHTPSPTVYMWYTRLCLLLLKMMTFFSQHVRTNPTVSLKPYFKSRPSVWCRRRSFRFITIVVAVVDMYLQLFFMVPHLFFSLHSLNSLIFFNFFVFVVLFSRFGFINIARFINLKTTNFNFSLINWIH